MCKRRALTRIEVLVVILIVLMAVIGGPALIIALKTGARKQAMSVTCQSNLKQWGIIFSIYTDENDDYFCMESVQDEWARGNWIVALRSLYRERADIVICPMAKKRITEGADYSSQGGAFKTYITGKGGIREEGSYGINCWLYNGRPGQITIQSRPVEWNWKTKDVRGGNMIPIFSDTMWVGGGPFYQNGSSESNRITPPQFDGQWSGADHEMKHFCINRHNGTINMLFMDFSVRSVGLKELWKLKWHRQFDINGFWTVAGGVQTSNWPQWMRGFKDY